MIHSKRGIEISRYFRDHSSVLTLLMRPDTHNHVSLSYVDQSFSPTKLLFASIVKIFGYLDIPLSRSDMNWYKKFNYPSGRSIDKNKDIKMCSVLALVRVDTHKMLLSHLVNWIIGQLKIKN